MYDIADVIDVEEASSVRPGSSILVSGPAMTGKKDLLCEILAAGARSGQGAVVVTTGDRAEAVVDDIASRAPDADGHQFGGIDCRSESGREEEELDSGAYVQHVSSPGDMTGIGIGITQCFDRLHDAGIDEGRIALTSLSTMLTYSDRQTVFKFCHVLSSRIDSADFLGVFAMDSSAHDEQTLQVIKQAFDGAVEIRESGGTREARIMGLQPNPSEWIEL